VTEEGMTAFAPRTRTAKSPKPTATQHHTQESSVESEKNEAEKRAKTQKNAKKSSSEEEEEEEEEESSEEEEKKKRKRGHGWTTRTVKEANGKKNARKEKQESSSESSSESEEEEEEEEEEEKKEVMPLKKRFDVETSAKATSKVARPANAKTTAAKKNGILKSNIVASDLEESSSESEEEEPVKRVRGRPKRRTHTPANHHHHNNNNNTIPNAAKRASPVSPRTAKTTTASLVKKRFDIKSKIVLADSHTTSDEGEWSASEEETEDEVEVLQKPKRGPPKKRIGSHSSTESSPDGKKGRASEQASHADATKQREKAHAATNGKRDRESEMLASASPGKKPRLTAHKK
jgi:hypothetical protein